MIEVKFDASEIIEGLGELGQNIKRGVSIAIQKSAFEIEGQSKINAPVDSGRLRDSIMVFFDSAIFQAGEMILDGAGGSSKLSATIMPMVEYAGWVHRGTDPHYIEGNNYLYWNGASHPVTHVFHPGTKPNPFMERGLEASEGAIREHFNREIERAVDNFNK